MSGEKHKVEIERPEQGDQPREGGQHEPALRVENLGQAELDEILAERDRLRAEHERLLRACADAENRSRRAHGEVQESYKSGVRDVARDVITSLDHFDVALGQDMATATVESIFSGVRAIKDELVRVLARHGVGVIEPATGDEFDPQRHEAMMKQPSADVEPGRIVAALQVGYTLHERVIRPAKVVVADESSEE